MKVNIALLLLVFIASCVTWNPTIGMTYDEFRNHWSYSDNLDSPKLVSDDGITRVYESDDVFYYFVDGKLNKIDQGQLFEQKVRVIVE